MGLLLNRPFGTGDLNGVPPSVETLGYSRLSLRDRNAAVFPRRQNSPGVQLYDLWVTISGLPALSRWSFVLKCAF